MIKRMIGLALASAVLLPSLASAQVWTSWNSGSCGSSVVGTLGSSTVTATGAIPGYQLAGSPNNPCGTLTSAGGQPAFSYFNGYTAYTQAGLTSPTQYGLVQLTQPTTITLTFSQAVIDPYIAFVSVGQPTLPVTYDFSTPVQVLSDNSGGRTSHWGTGSWSLADGNTNLIGNEFSGTVRLSGTFSSLTFSINPAENWHGFTVGAQSVVPEPSTYALMAVGLVAMGMVSRRRRGA